MTFNNDFSRCSAMSSKRPWNFILSIMSVWMSLKYKNKFSRVKTFWYENEKF